MSFAFFNITLTNKLTIGLCSLLIAECVRLRIINALLTLTSITSKQRSYTQLLYATNRILIIDIHHWVSEYYHLHPGALLPPNVWSTSSQVIWARNDVALSHTCAFGWQFTPCRSFHWFFVNIARLPHPSSSSSLSMISMLYYKQFQLFQLCAPGLCGSLCIWMHGWMQYYSRHSDRFLLHTDHSSNDSYGHTHLNYVFIFRH